MNKKIISTRFTKEYKTDHPFVSAGMAFIGSTTSLALAVCRAGGIGSIGVGPLPPAAVRSLIQEMKKETDRPFNINFITLFTSREHIQVCIDEQPPIVSFHFGHPPREFIDLLHQANIKVWEQVGSVDNAVKAAKDGVDLIIAQGSEAGGHNFGTLPGFVLVPQVVKAVYPTLVLAAGGITTGEQIAAALCLGADGVWVGTRLVASNEAFAHQDYKARLLQEDGTNTTLSPIFGPELPNFNPMRVIRNRVVKEFEGREDEVPTDTSQEPIIGKTVLFGKEFTLRRFTNFPITPATEGDFEEMPMLSGQGVGLIRDIRPAKEIIQEMMNGAINTISSIHES